MNAHSPEAIADIQAGATAAIARTVEADETPAERQGRMQFASLRPQIADEYIEVAAHLRSASEWSEDPRETFIQLADAMQEIGAYVSTILQHCRRQANRGAV